MLRRDLLLAALAPRQTLNLRDIAAVHVAIAEKDKGRRKVWGRIGGTPPEHESAAALADQLKRFLPVVEIEPFPFTAHRALDWEVKVDGKPLETAMPAPEAAFRSARFPRRSSLSLPAKTGAKFPAAGPTSPAGP